MKTKPFLRYALKYATFCFVFFWTTFSVNAQCPTITNLSPTILDASGYTFADLSADYVTEVGTNGIEWYTASSGGTFIDSSQLLVEGTYYVDDSSGSCNPTRTSITVTFQVPPTGQTLDGIFCSNDNPTVQSYIDDLQTNIPSGGSVEIYNDSALTDLASSIDLLSGLTNYYIVFVDILGNKSQIEEGQTIVVASPTDPTPQTTQEFCADVSPTVDDLDTGTVSLNFDWYTSLDINGNPSGAALSSLDPLVNGTYYIQIDNGCASNTVAVTVTIDTSQNAGTPGSLTYCENSIPTADFNLFDELGGSKDLNGTWSGDLATSNGDLGTVNIASLAEGIYVTTYTVPSTGVCPNATSSVTITIEPAPESGTVNTPVEFCEGIAPANYNLFDLLTGADLTGTWHIGTDNLGATTSNLVDLSTYLAGTHDFTYDVDAILGCDDELVTVSVIINPLPNTGTPNNPPPYCENDSALSNTTFDLFTLLTGIVDSGGTWSDDSVTPVAGVLSGNILDLSQLVVNPYNFTYSITDVNGCTNSTTVTITIEEAPESGTANTPVEFCEGVAPASYNLFDLLTGADLTGTWYIGTDNLGATTPNLVDLSTYLTGTHDFTYDVDAIAGCDDVLVTVSVIINPLPNTGIPNNPPPYCENDSALSNTNFNLFTLLNAPVDVVGGTWSDDSVTPVSGVLSGNILDLSQLVVNPYNFTYSITDVNGCTNSSTVTIIIEEAPESGIANTPVEFCEGIAPANYNLFDLLTGADLTGTWHIGTDNLGATTPNLVDLSTYLAGTHDFTYDVDAILGCDDELVTVSVIINPLPNTGTPNNPPPYCENDSALSNTNFNLFTLLNAPVDIVGGTWSDDSVTPVSGVLSGNILDLSQLVVNPYNFTYSITDANGCTNSSTVTIVVEEAPESGTVNAPVEFCLEEITIGQTYDLFELLTGEDQTGTWSDDDNSLALTANTVRLDELLEGTYNFTYDVDAIGTCDDVNVTVSVVINDTPAPTVTTPQEFCDTATVADLSATGTTIQWYDDATGGTPLVGTIALVDGEDYYATQTDATTGCESSIRIQVIATIYLSPNAGSLNATPISACNNNSNIDLDTGLDGTQDASGVWQDTDSTGALIGNIFNATGFSAGTYQFTYYVTASAPCVDDSTTITVTIDEPLSAGTDGTPLDLCSNNGTIDLFTQLGGTPDTGGTWSPALTSGTGVFDPLVDAPTTYTYTLTNACGTASSEIAVSVTLAPNAGADDSVLICVIDGVTDLFPLLGTSAQSGGTWSPALPSGTGEFDPNTDAAGVYTYTVTAVSPCTTNAIARITVTVDDSNAPTVDNPNPEFCLVDNPTVSNLESALTITGTVIWYEDAALTIIANTTDSLIDGEDYYATQTNSSGCESSTNVQITVTVNDTPTPTLITSNQELCINDNPTINELTSNIDFDSSSYSVAWYDAEDSGGSVVSESTSLSNGATFYAVLVDLVTGCESNVRLEVTPDLTSCGKLIIPDGFSPNGDGVNDTFETDNLAIIHPNFEIEIYNRNGNVVYKGNANTPKFNGKSNQSGTIGSGDLPVGVYFYIFNYNDGENKPEQGRLYLSR